MQYVLHGLRLIVVKQIKASDVNFWNKSFEVMQIRHRIKMYPPRVKMTVCIRGSNQQFKLPVKFSGCSNESQLDVELIFPLGMTL